ncbi:MAG: PhnA domain-containing protein [Bacteroidota bacterium]|nr:PhnA domain-containing protein [Bacteroidota bacterium]
MEVEVKDSNGNLLIEGDNVHIIKAIKVKGAPDLKQGSVMKNIKFTNNVWEIQGKIGTTMMVVKTEFVKKSN